MVLRFPPERNRIGQFRGLEGGSSVEGVKIEYLDLIAKGVGIWSRTDEVVVSGLVGGR